MPRTSIALAAALLGATIASSVLVANPPPQPTPHPPAALEGSSIPLCGAVEPTYADPELYRDSPIDVANEMPTGKIRRWARFKPGFVDLWIDRDHNGCGSP